MTTRFQGQTHEEAAALVFKSAARASMAVLIIPGDVADDLGGQGLQLVANQAGRNVITDRASRFHCERLFRPEAVTA